MPIHQLNPAEARQWQDKGKAIIIDVRSHDQYQKEHIPSAQNIPASQITVLTLPVPPEGCKLIVHCNRGGGATRLCNALMEEDSALELYHLQGGIEAWKASGFEVSQA